MTFIPIVHYIIDYLPKWLIFLKVLSIRGPLRNTVLLNCCVLRIDNDHVIYVSYRKYWSETIIRNSDKDYFQEAPKSLSRRKFYPTKSWAKYHSRLLRHCREDTKGLVIFVSMWLSDNHIESLSTDVLISHPISDINEAPRKACRTTVSSVGW